jgi:hypothetical protein
MGRLVVDARSNGPSTRPLCGCALGWSACIHPLGPLHRRAAEQAVRDHEVCRRPRLPSISGAWYSWDAGGRLGGVRAQPALVMGNHGVSGLRHGAMGSVADLARADRGCPVVILPQQAARDFVPALSPSQVKPDRDRREQPEGAVTPRRSPAGVSSSCRSKTVGRPDRRERSSGRASEYVVGDGGTIMFRPRPTALRRCTRPGSRSGRARTSSRAGWSVLVGTRPTCARSTRPTALASCATRSGTGPRPHRIRPNGSRPP